MVGPCGRTVCRTAGSCEHNTETSIWYCAPSRKNAWVQECCQSQWLLVPATLGSKWLEVLTQPPTELFNWHFGPPTSRRRGGGARRQKRSHTVGEGTERKGIQVTPPAACDCEMDRERPRVEGHGDMGSAPRG